MNTKMPEVVLMNPPDDDDERIDIEKMLDEYQNSLRRYFALEGADVTTLKWE